MKAGLPPQAVMRLVGQVVANCLSCQPNYWLRTTDPDIRHHGWPSYCNAFGKDYLLGIMGIRYIVQYKGTTVLVQPCNVYRTGKSVVTYAT